MEVNRNKSINARKDYQQAADKLGEQYDKQVKDLETTHKLREANQRENYLKQKEEMEETSENNLKEYDEKLKKEISERQKKYLTSLNSEKDAHIKERNKSVAENKYQLNSLQSSYQTAKDEADRLADYNKNEMEKRFVDGLTDRENHFNSKLSKIQKKNVEDMNKFRDDQNLEKKYLKNIHTDEKKKLIQETNLLRNQTNSRHQAEKERLRQNREETIGFLKSNAEDQVDNVIKNKDIQQEEQRQNYIELTESINKRNTEAFKKINEDNKKDKYVTDREHAKNRIELRRELNKIVNDPVQKKLDKQKELVDERWEARIDNLNEQSKEVKKIHQAQVDKITEDQKNESLMRDSEYSRELEKQSTSLRKERAEAVSDLRDEIVAQSTDNNKQVKVLQRDADLRETRIKKDQQRYLELQQQEYNKVISKLAEDRDTLASDLRDELAKEKTDFIEQWRRKSHDEKANLRENLTVSSIRKEEALNKKITHLEKANKKTVDTFEMKIDKINKKHAKELEKYKMLQSDIQNENRRAVKRDMLKLQQNFAKEKFALQESFERKLDRAKSDSEIHVSKLTERYETMLANERNERQRELQKKTSTLYDELVRYKQQADTEKSALIAQFETKIMDMEQSHRAQLELRGRARAKTLATKS